MIVVRCVQSLTLKFTFNKATLHHVEEDCDHDVQQLTLLCHMSSQLLVAEQLHTNMYNAVGHGVRLVAFHQRFHDECIMLNKCFRKSDLPDRKRDRDHNTIKVYGYDVVAFKEESICFQKPNTYDKHHFNCCDTQKDKKQTIKLQQKTRHASKSQSRLLHFCR